MAPDDPRALEVDVDHRVPLGLAQLVGEPVGADAGVVEQQVDAAEALDRGGDGGLDRGVVADVGDRDQARRPVPRTRAASDSSSAGVPMP